jgi:aryl-alcohol dehydrogenase-like predicted oxidoreductase
VQSYLSDKNFTILEELSTFTKAHEHTMTELAHAWLLANPNVSSVISGVTEVEQIQENVKGVEWAMTDEELAEVDQILGKN